jgi:hypothetical protein
MNYKEIIKRRSKGTTFTLWVGVDKSLKVDFRAIITQFKFEVICREDYETFYHYRIVYYGDKLLFGTKCVHLGREICKVLLSKSIM